MNFKNKKDPAELGHSKGSYEPLTVNLNLNLFNITVQLRFTDLNILWNFQFINHRVVSSFGLQYPTVFLKASSSP